MSETLLNEATEAPAPEQEATVANEPQSERPEWLPEKFNNPEDLAKSYTELSSKLGEKEESLRDRLIEELQNEAYSNRPESAGDYQLPESIDESEAVDNELLKWWSEHSFENGYSQDEFAKGIEMYMSAVQGNEPDLDAEAEKLGDNSSARIEAVSLFASKFFPEETMGAIERMCESADGIIALEHIMSALQDAPVASDTAPSTRLTEDSLRSMMNDPRYYDPARREQAYVTEIQEGFKKLYG